MGRLRFEDSDALTVKITPKVAENGLVCHSLGWGGARVGELVAFAVGEDPWGPRGGASGDVVRGVWVTQCRVAGRCVWLGTLRDLYQEIFDRVRSSGKAVVLTPEARKVLVEIAHFTPARAERDQTAVTEMIGRLPRPVRAVANAHVAGLLRAKRAPKTETA